MKRLFAIILTLCLVLGVLPEALAYDMTTHTHKWSQWYPEGEAGCVYGGARYRYCTECWTYEYEETPPLGHVPTRQVREEPTCTKPGYYITVCSRCGQGLDNGGSIPALGHDYKRSVAQEATCTSDGMAIYTCSRCGDAYREPIPATGHKWGGWTNDTPSTCVSYGTRYHVCQRCGTKEWERNYADGLGEHDWDEGVVTKAPTATEDGEKTYTCKIDPSHTKTEVIPATGGEEAKPGLTIKWNYDIIRETDGTSSITHDLDIIQPEKDALAVFTYTNSGNVPLAVVSYAIFGDGDYIIWNDGLYTPGKSLAGNSFGSCPVTNYMTPGTETEDLLGTTSVSVYCVGYDPETFVSKDNPGKELCRSETITRTWKVGKDDGLHPNACLEGTYDENAGVGKRYVGADIQFHYKVTNTGDCVICILYNNKELAPGEVWEIDRTEYVTETAVERGWYGRLAYVTFSYKEGEETITASTYNNQTFNGIAPFTTPEGTLAYQIPLTYPDGEEPEAAKPGLTLKWDYDEIHYNEGGYLQTDTDPGVLASNDKAWVISTYTNSGNVPLVVLSYGTFGDGSSDVYNYLTCAPGESGGSNWGSSPVTKHMTPGTATEDLLGTTTISFYCVGYDPETFVSKDNPGKELCRTETLTRTWKIAKKPKWEIPEESQLTAALQVTPGYEHSDPAGYQLCEEYATVLYVKNTGSVDLDDFTVSDPWDGSTFSGGPIVVNEVKSFPRANGKVTEENVGDGSIAFEKITVNWVDPESEETRPTYANQLALPVISKTGLLVKKSVANKPTEGDYFKEAEVIQWKLTVTNNSKESIKNVTVTDKGVTVGSFSEIAPGETRICTVPDYTVTAYDAEVTGYVINTATATGTDFKGITRSYPSNTAKAWTSKPVPDVPIFDPEGHFKPDELPKGDDWCALTLDAMCDAEARFTLHACTEHLGATRNAEALGLSDDWAGSVEVWRAEIDKMYEALADAVDETGIEVLTSDQEAFYAYADAVQALYGDQAEANLMRMRCAELCCMLHTAPDALSSSLAGNWAHYDSAETWETSSREIGYLKGSDSEVTEHYAGEAAEALMSTVTLMNASSSYIRDEVFSQSLSWWISALDDQVNPAYKAADKEQRKRIAGWRRSLDSLSDAEEVFLRMLYEANSDTVQEQIMRLYMNAVLFLDCFR